MSAEQEAIARRVIEDPKWASKQDTRFWRAHVASLLDSLAAARAESDALRAALEGLLEAAQNLAGLGLNNRNCWCRSWERDGAHLFSCRSATEATMRARAALAPSPAEPAAPEREP